MKKLIFLLLFVSLAYPQSASYSPQTSITTANTMAVDAFGRFRASFPVTLFDAQNQYNSSPLFWQDSLGANADTNFIFNGSSVQLAIASAGAGNAIRQTRQYFRYQSGKSQFVLLTAVPHVGKTNSIKRWGYFDSQDGVFFQLSGTTLSIVKRSSRSGAVVDSAIAQTAWNMDKLDGTGSSGTTMRTYNAQVFFIDIAWLGVSRVRCGIIGERGNAIVAHEFQNANINTGVYMRTANLPVRYEIVTSTGVADTLTAICSSVQSEAGDENENGLNQLAGYGVVPTTVSTTFTPLISIRPKITFNGKTNRALIKNIAVSLTPATATIEWRIVYDGVLTGASFVSSGTNSTVNYDTSATAISGGEYLDGDFIVAGGSGGGAYRTAGGGTILEKLPLTLDIAGTIPKTITLVARALAGTATVNAIIKWTEIY